MTQEESNEIAAWVHSDDFPCLFTVVRDDAEVAARIITETCLLMGVDPRALKGKRRSQHVACARQMAMYGMREMTDLSYPTIGRWFARDHSTVIHAHTVIAARMAAESAFKRLIEGLLARVLS